MKKILLGISTLGMCLVVLSFCANSAWAQVKPTDDYERLVRVSPVTVIDAVAEQPSQVALLSSYPNPFNPETTIRFDVREGQQVRLAVFDLLGRQVALLVSSHVEVGQHEVRFQAGDLPSGTYFIRLQTAADVAVRQIVLMK